MGAPPKAIAPNPHTNLLNVYICIYILQIKWGFDKKNYISFPAALGPGVYWTSNRNEYQKHENNVSAEYSAVGAWD
jgi:hypothetical protein